MHDSMATPSMATPEEVYGKAATATPDQLMCRLLRAPLSCFPGRRWPFRGPRSNGGQAGGGEWHGSQNFH